MGVVLYVLLVCSDEACDAAYEGCGELDELERLSCELCGCALQAVAFAEAEEAVLPRPSGLELRKAA
jgi:hypothetical protein